MPSGRQVHVPGPEVRLDHVQSGGQLTIPAPGEHTAEVLAELGYSQPELDAMAANGVISLGQKARAADE
jgi:crotonobetainyl-CoA:carnitine CoA-transferase CaiB-like acyl-CoA transferase